MKSLIAAIVVLASLAVGARGQTPGPNAAVKTTTVPLDRLNEQQARNVKTEWVTYKGRKGLRVIDTAPPDVADGIQLVILNKTEFRDGTIEIELTGEPSPTAKAQHRGDSSVWPSASILTPPRTSQSTNAFTCVRLMGAPTTRCDATIRPNTFLIRTSPGFDCVRSSRRNTRAMQTSSRENGPS
jgi:hypothetical protein